MERKVAELEERRDLTRVIVHVDMDAFYAAVETRDCPELKDKPMAVGCMSMLVSFNPKHIIFISCLGWADYADYANDIKYFCFVAH